MSKSFPASVLTPPERVAEVARVRRAVARALGSDCVLPLGELVLVAGGGGPDSTALVDARARLAAPRDLHLWVAHVDHGLRPGSAEEAQQVADLAAARSLPFHALRVTVESSGSLQDRARSARHAALRGLADEAGASAIALGLTAVDQAETVMMRALSGATQRALRALGTREGRLAK